MIIADTVNEQMHELILNLILERKIKPGERVNPKQLAEENHVSLMPVRNALQQLTTEGLLETHQRVGVFVREYSDKELAQIGEVRKLYELYCLEHFADHIDRREVLELYQQIEKREPRSRAMLALDEQLHRMIVEASENPFLIQQYSGMQNLIRIHMYSENDNALESKRAHLDILTAIYKANYSAAYLALSNHLDASMQMYKEKVNDRTGT
ncbi:MAG: GntR family transcriptional regulator [Oscillospiraceae bacterium]